MKLNLCIILRFLLKPAHNPKNMGRLFDNKTVLLSKYTVYRHFIIKYCMLWYFSVDSTIGLLSVLYKTLAA
ncbi:uncharacterized protein NEPG_02002 [Nematocida parisii ERTm1]|uniref:Uncharacterized protein n=1 Tax=Nematocida parisii (strain ERTm3) TaxID=935791 RepID=I3EF28_NEMP3|nr:uncharacterized protein NEPG_02002 [Nematocida parisii ERTm1]EIJ87825.1 hypothetical protein NEQG_01897 [Nematocida parisii ERTm3]EIJ93046.1 hypothetical protein NEPG_02002 [Nematocida parisii ERTm1]|eukprot:XP_013059829.1 hypothetical protein NEPG_02002 [Nematocida parisii ERTm1]